MNKTFQIEDTKYFKIEGSKPKKDFIVATSSVFPVEVPGANRDMMFAHQENDADCGPCLVINICNALNTTSSYDSVLNVRQQANRLRQNNQRKVIAEEEWFFVDDVALALQEKGLLVEQFSVRSDAMEIEARATRDTAETQGVPYVMYTGAGRHFRGIYWDGQNYSLLDSKLNQIVPVRVGDVENMMRLAKQSDRDETIGIVTKPQ